MRWSVRPAVRCKAGQGRPSPSPFARSPLDTARIVSYYLFISFHYRRPSFSGAFVSHSERRRNEQENTPTRSAEREGFLYESTGTVRLIERAASSKDKLDTANELGLSVLTRRQLLCKNESRRNTPYRRLIKHIIKGTTLVAPTNSKRYV